MINVMVADSNSAAVFGIEKYYENNDSIKVLPNVSDFNAIPSAIKKEKADILIVFPLLENFNFTKDIEKIIEEFPKLKVIYCVGNLEPITIKPLIRMGIKGIYELKKDLTELTEMIFNVSKDKYKYPVPFVSTKDPEKLFKRISQREFQVLELIAKGKKNLEIANTVGINDKTISTFKKRLFNKFNVTSNVEMVDVAIKMGIITKQS
jgi:two-component system, NarL family, response regulator, fimbrial Z protein, FimZ